jgi:glycosyltransferase involved in cell wall biosynthesis
MGAGVRPVIAFSAVNITEMGPLAIIREALSAAAELFGGSYEIIALVHRKNLFDIPQVTYVEFPGVKRSWLKRLKFEFFDLKRLSRRWNADLWISMHDITPRVVARRQVVYCHNASPFYPFSPRDLKRDWKFAAFTLFYRFLYRINIRANTYVVVQQDWIRQAFQRMYGVSNVIVAHPAVLRLIQPTASAPQSRPGQRPCRFFYPCYPRVFKNVEILLEAARLLAGDPAVPFEIWLTFNGAVNAYAAEIVKRYGDLPQVRFLGALSRGAVYERYQQADCLVFASKLETWGLPITEFKQFRKPMLLADLPYARETVGDHDGIGFFAADDAQQLADHMKAVANGAFQGEFARANAIAPPFCESWDELFSLLLSDNTAMAATGKEASCALSV